MRWFGYNTPFLLDSTILPPQSDERLIKNDLLQLLLTIPGERRMRPTFGTPLRAFPFDPQDNKSVSSLQVMIKVAIDKFEPRVKFKNITVKSNPDKHVVYVTVFVALTLDENQILSVETVLPQSTPPVSTLV